LTCEQLPKRYRAAAAPLERSHFQILWLLSSGQTSQVVPVLDGAGWHTGKQAVVPKGIEPVFLPPYDPELQPAERLWPWPNGAVANRVFEKLEELEEVLAHRCWKLSQWQQWVSGSTQFHRWPRSKRKKRAQTD
jgi:transposase